MIDLYSALRSGRVRRWHASPDMADVPETDAEHQWMVAVIVTAFAEALDMPEARRLALLQAAIFHDSGETVGDIPLPVKQAHPELSATHAAVEKAQRQAMGTDFQPDDDDHALLDLADRLAAWVTVVRYRPGLLRHGEWNGAMLLIESRAIDLGVYYEVVARVRHGMNDREMTLRELPF